MMWRWFFFVGGFLAGLAAALAVWFWILPGMQPDPITGVTEVSEGEIAGAEEFPDEVDLVLSVPEYPYVVMGRVTDTRGQAVGDASVRLVSPEGGLERHGQTDSEGFFEIMDMPLALYIVEASAEGYGLVRQSGVTPGGPLVELVLEAAADVIGRLVQSGVGVGNTQVLIGGPGLYPPVVVTSSQDGRFLIDGIQRSTHLEIVALGRESGSILGTVQSISTGGQFEVDMHPACPLRIVVRDALDDTRITTGVFTISNGPLQILSVSESFSEGYGELVSVPPQTLYLRVQAQNTLGWRGYVEHRCEAPIVVELDRGAAVVGRVETTDGLAVGNARILANLADGIGPRLRLTGATTQAVGALLRADGSTWWPPRVEVFTAQDGSFSLGGVPVGNLRLSASVQGMRARSSVEVRSEGSGLIEGVIIQMTVESSEP